MWNTVGISFTGHFLSLTTWENLITYIGGEVKTASDLGITSIEFNNSSINTPDLTTLAIYIAEGANYGVVGWDGSGGAGTYYRQTCVYIIPLEAGDIEAIGSVPWGFNPYHTTARVWAGDGFSMITTVQTTYTRGLLFFDTFHDQIHDRDCICVGGRKIGSAATNIQVCDLEYGISDYGSAIFNNAIAGYNALQGDGTLYVEIINLHVVTTSRDYPSLLGGAMIAKNIYQMFYDYDNDEKTVMLNGIMFTSVLDMEVFFPTE